MNMLNLLHRRQCGSSPGVVSSSNSFNSSARVASRILRHFSFRRSRLKGRARFRFLEEIGT